MPKSEYPNDKYLEELFAKWLDENFYDELAKKEIIFGWYRVNGQKLQKKGKDTIVIKSISEQMIIDEKAALHYINKNIPTFAFEIKNQNSDAVGWLYNDTLETEYYLLAWPNAKEDCNGHCNIEKYDDFIYSEVMLIRKTDIINMLEKKGLNEKSISDKVNLFKKKATESNNCFELTNGIKLNFNFSLHERPINIVINKDILSAIAMYHDTIGFICPKCHHELKIRSNRNGVNFIGCTNYPTCHYTRSINLCKFE